MKTEMLRGDLVQLVAVDKDSAADGFNRWSRDSGYLRLLDARPSRPSSVKAVIEWIEKDLENPPSDLYWFLIKKLEDNRIIGDISLDGIMWQHGESFVGIGIGERKNWDHGFGTDAMRIILHYAFRELNLYRISLNVFAYNQRAIRTYEKLGFQHEGFQRGVLSREASRWDIHYMGILRPDWLKLTNQQA